MNRPTSSIYTLFLFIALLTPQVAEAQFLLQTTGAGQARPNLSALSPEVRPQMSAINQAVTLNEESASDPAADFETPCKALPESHGMEAAASLSHNFADIITPASALTGKCPKATSGPDLAENLAIDMRNKIGLHPKIAIKKSDGKLATTDDWIAVDLLARTLYGEVAGKNGCMADGYLEAVGRVIMNRAEFMSDPNHEKHTNFFKDETKVKNPYARAAISPHEFQTWKNPTRYLICPASENQKTYHDENGKVIASTNVFDYPRWFGALQIASEMIFNEHDFRCKTEGVKSLFYTKSSIAPGKNFVHVRGVVVSNQKIDNAECVQLWDSPNAPFKPTPTAGCR